MGAKKVNFLKGVFYAFVFSIFQSASLYAQPQLTDSAIQQQAYENTLKVYHDFLGRQAGINMGPIYAYYLSTILSGNPFLDSTTARPGTIVYNGIRYDEVPMLFDIAKNTVVVVSPYSNFMQELLNNRISRFSLNDHDFVNLTAAETGNQMPGGFYEILFDGKASKLYKKHLKAIKEIISNEKVNRVIEEAEEYYILKDGRYHPVTRAAQVAEIYKDHAQQMRAFMRNIHFRNTRNHAGKLPEIVAHYETLSAKSE